MESKNLPVQTKRGRPAKNAAIYDEDGTLLLSEEERAELNENNRELDRLLANIEDYTRTAAMRLLCLGELLYEMASRSYSANSCKKLSALTGINENRVSLATRIYKKFGGCPETLKGMTVTELMPLIRKKKLPDAGQTRQIQYAASPGGGEVAVRESFGIAPLSGAALRRYRIRAEPQDGKYYLLEEGCGAAIPIASLSVDTPRNAEQQAAFREMQDEIQCAMERYYAVIEREEEDE